MKILKPWHRYISIENYYHRNSYSNNKPIFVVEIKLLDNKWIFRRAFQYTDEFPNRFNSKEQAMIACNEVAIKEGWKMITESMESML